MILVFCELDGATVAETSLEALRMARELSAAGGGIAVRALVVEQDGDASGVAELLGRHGVEEVLVARVEGLSSYAGAAWATALLAAREKNPTAVLMGPGTPRGMEVLAHAAARLGVPMAANVVKFGGLSPFVVTRQVVGGAAQEEMRLGSRPAVLTVAGHAVEAEPAAQPAAGRVTELPVTASERDTLARVVSTEPGAEDHSGDLKSARVVVGAGRGAGGPEGFDGVLELASLLHGQLGVSRVVTSLGWRPHHEQVGQTGSRISPELYVPCGISGAIQHWAGMSSSKVIVAINTDGEAPMVTKADYAVVGDMHEVVPAIIEEIHRRKG